jgi:hypothetical protein
MEKITTKTIEQENPHFVLEVIGETVAEQAVEFSMRERLAEYKNLEEAKRKEMDEEYKQEVRGLTKYLCERANTHYQYNKSFNKDVKAKGNKGRDYLYMFMYHWVGAHHNGAQLVFKKDSYKKSVTNWYRDRAEFEKRQNKTHG